MGEPEPSQAAQKVEALLCLHCYTVCAIGPSQVLSEVDTNIFEAPHPLHWNPTDGEGDIVPGLHPAKFHNQLLCLFSIQGEVVGLTP